jgi:hypothetical protein
VARRGNTSSGGIDVTSTIVTNAPAGPSWLTERVKKLADYGIDDHPADDPERVPVTWIVAALDDCDECGDPRVELTVEEAGKHGAGIVAHLAPDSARRLRTALALALREMGEAPGD